MILEYRKGSFIQTPMHCLGSMMKTAAKVSILVFVCVTSLVEFVSSACTHLNSGQLSTVM